MYIPTVKWIIVWKEKRSISLLSEVWEYCTCQRSTNTPILVQRQHYSTINEIATIYTAIRLLKNNKVTGRRFRSQSFVAQIAKQQEGSIVYQPNFLRSTLLQWQDYLITNEWKDIIIVKVAKKT